MRKRATTQWTMAKLITMILAVFLLALIIYGTQTKGFGPLKENIEGRFNEVLIFMGFRDSGLITCGDSFKQSIDDVGSGEFFPCEDSCGFVLIDPKELLDFSNFTVDKGGFSMRSKDMSFSDDDEAYAFGSAESQKHKDAYEMLNDTVGEFLASEDMSYEDFVGNMSFDVGRTLFYGIDDWGWGNWNTFYVYGKDGWREGEKKDGVVVAKGDIVESEKVFSEVIEARKKGKLMLEGYNELSREDVSKFYFDKWFYGIKNDFETKRLAGEVSTLHIERRLVDFEGISAVYNLMSENVWVSGQGKTDERSMVDNLYWNYHFENDEISWWYDDGKNGKYSAVTNFEIALPQTRDKFMDIEKKWKASKKARDDLVGDLKKQGVITGDISFDGGHVFSTISTKSLSGEKFEVYYKYGKPVLVYNGEDSAVSNFVGFSDSDWKEFIKINKIYEYFKLRRCGNE